MRRPRKTAAAGSANGVAHGQPRGAASGPVSLSLARPASEPVTAVESAPKRSRPPPLPSSLRLSLSDVLEKVSVVGKSRALQHTCVHIYVPHARFASTSEKDFSIELMPSFAGWRAAWLDVASVVKDASSFGMDVLGCTVRWACGSAHPAFVTMDGRLVLHVPSEGACRGVQVAFRKRERDLAAVSMSHRLTRAEIDTGVRGVVLGSVAESNNRRSVSHIIGPASGGQVDGRPGETCYVCNRFGGDEGKDVDSDLAGEEVVLDKSEIEKYAPQLMREYESRITKKLSVLEAREVLVYLEQLFSRARANDIAVRHARRATLEGIGRGDGTVPLAHGVQALDRMTATLMNVANTEAAKAASGPAFQGGHPSN